MSVIEISEVDIQLIKPVKGLIGFASLVINGGLFLSSIGIHQKFGREGFRLTYPTKKSSQIDRPIFHPITRQINQVIEEKVFLQLKDVMRLPHDRHYCANNE